MQRTLLPLISEPQPTGQALLTGLLSGSKGQHGGLSPFPLHFVEELRAYLQRAGFRWLLGDSLGLCLSKGVIFPYSFDRGFQFFAVSSWV
jgi:hypothetical protein